MEFPSRRSPDQAREAVLKLKQRYNLLAQKDKQIAALKEQLSLQSKSKPDAETAKPVKRSNPDSPASSDQPPKKSKSSKTKK